MMRPATFHATRLARSPLYQRREAAYIRTHAETKLRAAYYTTPLPDAETVWPALFPYLHSEDATP